MAENVRVVARVKARPEKVAETHQLLTGLIGPTRNEQGCISYQLFQNDSDPTDFTFVEEWQSTSAFEGHLASPHVQEALPQLGPLTVEPPDIRRYSLLA
jgi:quinol monooxygenase YgiN